MLDCKKIARFKCNEFVKVHKTVEENADLLIIFFQFVEVEVSLFAWLDHVVHLAQ